MIERTHIGIFGKRNAGKSSIINKLLGENRVIVSDIAGTTRDAVDTEIVHNGTEYVFIDTAGLRRKNKIKEELEKMALAIDSLNLWLDHTIASGKIDKQVLEEIIHRK